MNYINVKRIEAVGDTPENSQCGNGTEPTHHVATVTIIARTNPDWRRFYIRIKGPKLLEILVAISES